MAYTNANGDVLTKAQLLALTENVTYPADKRFTAPVYQTFTYRNTSAHGAGKRKAFVPGQVVTAAYIDGLYVAGTVTNVAPATTPLAGGKVTVTGTNLDGATGATVGGTAVTNFKVLSNTKIEFTAPAKTAGNQALIIVDDGGNIVGTSITYA